MYNEFEDFEQYSAPEDIPTGNSAESQEYDPEEDIFGEGSTVTTEPKEPSDDFLTSYLKSKGIDRSKVKMLNEEGEEEEVPFDELSDEEKITIMNTQDLPFSSDEINIIQFFRKNKVDLDTYTQYIKNKAVEEYVKNNVPQTYSVDNIDDLELLRHDLSYRYPDLTEDEIEDQIDRISENEAIFDKVVKNLRTEYKQLEDQQKEQALQEEQDEKEQQFLVLRDSLVNVARNTDELYGFGLEDNDKEEILDFLLRRDVNGQTEFSKLYNNPDAVFKLAWFAKKGGDAFNALNDYWTKQLSEARKTTQGSRTVNNTNKTNTKNKQSDPYGLDEYFNK